jgi:hypothetical protein
MYCNEYSVYVYRYREMQLPTCTQHAVPYRHIGASQLPSRVELLTTMHWN